MRRFFQPSHAPGWLGEVLTSVRGALSDEWPTPLKLKSFTVAGVPPAADWAASMIYVTNETGGATPAFSDGTDWRRVTDRAIIA